MKKIIIVIAVVLMTSVSGAYAAPVGDTQPYTAIVPSMGAIAEWVADFTESYNENGVYQAVSEVFDEGRTPEEILANALDLGINPQNLVAALYCAGAKFEDIRTAADNNGISEMILVAGADTADTVCGDDLADTQAYTEIVSEFAGIPAGASSGNSFATSSGFTN